MRTIINIILAVLFITKINFPQQPNFLPLAIGNEYQTYDGNYYLFEKIERDTIYLNGEKYFTFKGPIYEFGDCRVDSSGNVLSASFGGEPEEKLLFKADAVEGDNWAVSWNYNPLVDTLFARCYYVNYEFVFNEWRIVKGVTIFDDSYTYYSFHLADGIGLIFKQYDDGSYAVLNYAKVIGIIYGSLVGIDDDEPLNPSSFSVSQNYPNPFNGLTKVDLVFPSSAFNDTPELTIYDLLGKIVYRKNLEEIQNQTVTLNTNELGMSSGVYFYSVFYNGRKLTKKFTLLK